MSSGQSHTYLNEYERIDDLMRCGRRIIQDTREFCFSMDAVLLAHFPRYRKNQSVLELGTGTGVIPLLIADEVSHIEAIELNPVMAELACRNVSMNCLDDRIHVTEGDYREIQAYYGRESFDLVLANPPYRPVDHGRTSPIIGKARARHEFTATLDDVVKAARYALRYHGTFAMVHLPERLGEVVVSMHEHQMEPRRLRMVQPREGKAPKIMLIEAVAGAAPGGLNVMPPLIVRDEDGNYTKEILEIYGMQSPN